MKNFWTTRTAVLITGLAVLINLLAQASNMLLLQFPAAALAFLAIVICFKTDKEDMKLVRRLIIILNTIFIAIFMFMFMLIQQIGTSTMGM